VIFRVRGPAAVLKPRGSNDYRWPDPAGILSEGGKPTGVRRFAPQQCRTFEARRMVNSIQSSARDAERYEQLDQLIWRAQREHGGERESP